MAWNEPLFESANFVVFPSLGALVEGWLLIVPKQHFVSIGALPDSLINELQRVRNVLIPVLQECYGAVCVMEHGPSVANHDVGCGVDHAHLHLVPFQSNLAVAVAPFLPDSASWTPAGTKECQQAYRRGNDYLYFEQPLGSGYIATHQKFGSQLFRRAIADCIGIPDEFNWRKYPQLSNVSATTQRLSAWLRSRPSILDIANAAA